MERIFDDYCKKHIEGPDLYCERVNMDVPPMFCQFTCWGDWRKWRKEDVEKLRSELIKDITEEEKNNQDLVSVIIPCHSTDKEYLERTVQAVEDTALGPIEILSSTDDTAPPLGQRKIMNELARVAKGKYLFKLDAHCNLSHGWDARMKSSCGENVIVTTIFDGLNTETWKGNGRDNGFVRMTEHLETRFVRGWKAMEEREIEEETMGISGTAFMITKDYYWELGGCDENLGEWGALGAEWACKTWLTGGRCIIRTDVVCYHLFRKFTPFDIDVAIKKVAYEKLYDQWVIGKDPRIKKPMAWLVMKFHHYIKARIYNQF
jgi:hypothetical protein